MESGERLRGERLRGGRSMVEGVRESHGRPDKDIGDGTRLISIGCSDSRRDKRSKTDRVNEFHFFTDITFF